MNSEIKVISKTLWCCDCWMENRNPIISPAERIIITRLFSEIASANKRLERLHVGRTWNEKPQKREFGQVKICVGSGNSRESWIIKNLWSCPTSFYDCSNIWSYVSISWLFISDIDGSETIQNMHLSAATCFSCSRGESLTALETENEIFQTNSNHYGWLLNFISQVAEILNINWNEFRSPIKTFKFLFSAQLFNHFAPRNLLLQLSIDLFTCFCWCNRERCSKRSFIGRLLDRKCVMFMWTKARKLKYSSSSFFFRKQSNRIKIGANICPRINTTKRLINARREIISLPLLSMKQ